MAIRADISEAEEWFTGEDRVLEFTVYKADNVTPQDISGWDFSWFLKRGVSDPDVAAVLAKTNVGSPSPAEIVIIDGPTGRVDVIIEADDTRELPAKRYHHELKRLDAGEELVESYGAAVLRRALHLDAP